MRAPRTLLAVAIDGAAGSVAWTTNPTGAGATVVVAVTERHHRTARFTARIRDGRPPVSRVLRR